MGFFDRLLSGKVFSDARPASLVAELEISNHKYILNDLDWEFTQEVDDKNRPCSALYGGKISLSISEPVDQTIFNWIINSGTKHSGQIKFYHHNNNFEEGAQLEIKFIDAICVNFHKQVIEQGKETITTLVLSSRVLKIGSEEFQQKWSGY
ncbi:type VI secretion system tube protein TssD [Saccharicrinis aurantiacus]|uniref:type VI secretion system tube protein TssD n=1 Tax=Saccharicrinis aurantiacus TaxID=1849719 RepID=UPI00094F6EDF|nr:type VI secretion system tube protein TssD [Saccharicrinis aurantiacus]